MQLLVPDGDGYEKKPPCGKSAAERQGKTGYFRSKQREIQGGISLFQSHRIKVAGVSGYDSAQADQCSDADYAGIVVNMADDVKISDRVSPFPVVSSAQGSGIFNAPDFFNLLTKHSLLPS
jgi:hypothetical protein